MTTKPSTTVLNSMRLLDLLCVLGQGSVRQLAERSGLSTAATHRTLISLRVAGMVEDGDGGGYRLAPHLFALGLRVPRYQRLRDSAGQPLQALSLRVRLPAVLSLSDRQNVVYVLSADAQGRRSPSRPGDIRAMHCTASGKVLLAHADAVVRQSVLAAGLTRRTTQTITTSARLLDELEGVRRTGVASDVGEYAEDWTAVAAPVYGPSGAVEAALAVCAPPGLTDLRRTVISPLLRSADVLNGLLSLDPPTGLGSAAS